MTLAAAILLFFSCTSADAALMPQSAPQSSPDANATGTQQSPSTQTGSDSTKPSSAQPASKTPENKAPAAGAKKPQQRKKVTSEATCDPAPAASAPGSNTSPAPAPAGSNAEAPSTPQPEKNCPPPKTIVPEGGVTEQSIQLAGGSSGGETRQKGESTNQMLTATEENLKKVDEARLSEAQRNSVSQIREFEDQSKKALKAADFERAHTLAWKAKVLSDDLVAPKK